MYPDVIHFAAIMKKHDARIFTMPFPNVGPRDVVVKMQRIHMCTTDFQQWMGLRDHQGFPMASGHECSGVVVGKGEEVGDSIEIGQQVGIMANYCGYCYDCLHGYTSTCTNLPDWTDLRDENGFIGEKYFADYTVVDRRLLLPINNEIDPAEAAFLEPVATAVKAAHLADIRPAEDVVIVGAGTMGLVNAQVAKAFGARVIVSDLSDKKVARAKEIEGLEVIHAGKEDPVKAVYKMTGGKGADTVIMGVGNTMAYRQGFDMMKETRGKFVLFPAGYPKPEMEFDPNQIHYRRIQIIGTVDCDLREWVLASELISKRLVNCSYFMEGKLFPLREINDAYAAAAQPDSYRVTIDCQGI